MSSRNRLSTSALSAILALTGLIGSASADQTYTLTDLSAASNSGGGDGPFINAKGEVVGINTNGGVFIYNQGMRTDILPQGYQVLGLNDSGTLVGNYSNITGTYGFTYANGSVTTCERRRESATVGG